MNWEVCEEQPIIGVSPSAPIYFLFGGSLCKSITKKPPRQYFLLLFTPFQIITAENNENVTINVFPLPFQIKQANIAARSLLLLF